MKFDKIGLKFDIIAVKLEEIAVKFEKIAVKFDKVIVKFDIIAVQLDIIAVKLGQNVSLCQNQMHVESSVTWWILAQYLKKLPSLQKVWDLHHGRAERRTNLALEL